jgi:hypothetical protein
MLCLPGGSVFGLGNGKLVSSVISSPQDTGNNVAHSAASVGTQDLDGNSAVGSVTIAVLVDVILRDDLAPGGAALKLDVVDVDTGIDDVHVDTFTVGRVVIVESESSETEFRAVRDTRKTLGGSAITNHAMKPKSRNIPMEQSAECRGREQ